MNQGLDGLGGSFDEWIRREVELSGRSRSEVVNNLKVVVKTFINEDFFMPRPEVFLHTNWADDPRWQLLRPEFTVYKKDEFLGLPVLLPAFYRFGLRLISKRSCVLESDSGKCKIWIAADNNNAHRLTLSAELHLLETSEPNYKYVLEDFHKMVIQSRHNDFFYFEIRFPILGIFRIDIYGGLHKSHRFKLCQFKLIVNEIMPDFKFVPLSPEPLMWGPGPECLEYGLELPSKPTGIVRVYQQTITPSASAPVNRPPKYTKRHFHFNLHIQKSQMMAYLADLHGSLPDDYRSSVTPLDQNGVLVKKKREKSSKKKDSRHPNDIDYSQWVECYVENKDKRLVIDVDTPHQGEFALEIRAVPYTLEEEDGQTRLYGTPVTVCVYMLRTMDDNFREVLRTFIYF